MMYDKDCYRLTNVDISVLGAIAIIGLYVAKMAKLAYGDWWIDFWHYAPNTYRMWEQFTIWLSGGDGLFVLYFTILSWVVCVFIAYMIMRPIEHPEIFFLWLLWMGYFGYIMNGPMYLLFALLSRYAKERWIPILLIPLALIKEVALFIGAMYLLLYVKEHRKESVVGSALGALAYIAVRVLIGEVSYYPTGAQFFLPMIQYVLVMSIQSFLVFIIANTILLLFTIDTLRHYRLWVLVLIPNLLFALFWEAQLWFPLIILLLKRDVKKEKIMQ